VNVLYWGYRENTPISYFRAGMFRGLLSAHGINAVYLTLADLAIEAIDWADIVVFRGWYSDEGITEQAWDHAAGKAARIYDNDDWNLERPDWAPFAADIRAQHPLIRRMTAEADLVTVATPNLAERFGAFSRQPPLVVRNAVDMSLYQADQPRTDERTTVLFYGPNSRLLDYFGYIDEKGKRRPGHAFEAVRGERLRSIWIGCEGDTPPREFDVVARYDWDMLRFFRTLANAGADLGVCPLVETPFNVCKSELHWLDMTAAGIPVVAQRFMGRGPYSVIRDGIDGLMAHGAHEWRDAVRRLAREPALRTDLVAAARARLIQEYSPTQRAGEWAEAFGLALN
jgi:glycosyltransferase involved in cell wall biosynthesis